MENTNLKATAVRIGKSKNETIYVDGEVFIKSSEIGKWNYIVRITRDFPTCVAGCVNLCKARTLESAEKINDIPCYPIKGICKREIVKVERAA